MNHRRVFSIPDGNGVLRCFFPVLCLALTACAHRTGSPAATSPAGSRPTTAAATSSRPGPTAPLLPPAMVSVGHVVSVDEPARTAIIEFSRYATLPGSPDGATLFARDRDLRPVARLEGTPYLRSLILGVKIVEGRPVVGDEVVVPAPLEPTQATPPPPAARPNR